MTTDKKAMSKQVEAVRYDALEGKTVARAGFDFSTLLISFTDGTVLALSAHHDYDGSPHISFEQSRIELLNRSWLNSAEEAGLITHEEWKQYHAEQDRLKIQRLEGELKSLKNKDRS